MANYFRDNADIRFLLRAIPFSDVIETWEDGFRQAEEHDYAPESVEDALDSYERVLGVLGGLAGDFIAPRAEDVDLEGPTLDEDGRVHYARGMAEAIERLGKADLMGFTLPRRHGGLNFPQLVYAMAIEIISRADASLMNIFGLQGIAETIEEFADEAMKTEVLPRFCAGEVTSAMVLTEPDAGSDLQAVQLKAIPGETEDQWYLKGVKRFITNGCGDVLLVLARSEPDIDDGRGLSFFYAERGPTVRVRRLENKLGIHGSPTCELQFNMTPARLIGERRLGLIRYAMAMMNGARLGIAAQSIGIAEAAYRDALDYAYSREQFGRPIKDFPAVAELLVQMKVQIDAARALTYYAAVAVDRARSFQRIMDRAKEADDKDKLKEARAGFRSHEKLAKLLTPMCKYYCSEMCNRVTYEAISVLGGSGFMKDYKLERLYRDARITSIYEGTSQLQVVAAVSGVLAGRVDAVPQDFPVDGYPDELKDLAAKATACHERVKQAVETLKTRGDNQVTDLYARNLVDMGIDVVCGYALLWQASINEEKVPVARKWIVEADVKSKANLDLITTADKTTLTHFAQITGEPQPIGT
ncbi:MAG TPA: acyl-CoA dehydrogenase family protein [Planctomycetota bacterium]|nr:acyl-CoA dehydrogenase family protein [Planctomycetota bacterium]